MQPLSRICLPGSTAHFQPLFTTLSGSFIKSRLYILKNNVIIPISSNYNAFWQICLVIIFRLLYFYRLRYFDLGRASRIVHQSSAQWMISTSRVVIPRVTLNLRPSPGVSTPIWLSVNCYCFTPHYKSLSLLSLLSVSTLFFPKIISRCICRMLLYMSKLTQQAPERFWKPNKNRPQGKRTRAFVSAHPFLSPYAPYDWSTCHASYSRCGF